MGLIRKISQLGRQLRNDAAEAPAPQAGRQCRIETLEPRRLLAADVHVGAVYIESDLGNDDEPDIIEVTFEGGAEGTQLTKLVIDGDKFPDGITSADIIFDTEAGGLGDFNHSPYATIEADGFTIDSVSVSDGSSEITFFLSGWDAGEKLIFSIDVDEANFVDAGGNIDVNAIVEGKEFQHTRLNATFESADYETLELNGTFYDDFDGNSAASATAAGSTLDLPPDRYSTAENQSNRTAGAFAHAPQIPRPSSISGRVHADPEGDCEVGPEDILLEGVQIDLLDADGNVLQTTFTDFEGRYKFDDLPPGEYQVYEHQPDGYYDGDEHVGSVGGQLDGVDTIYGVELIANTHGVNYDFCEHVGVTLSGHVYHDQSDDGVFDASEEGIGGATVILYDEAGTEVARTTSSAVPSERGYYEFTGLEAGKYRVVELQPDGWIDGKDTAGSHGGTPDNPPPGDEIDDIQLVFGEDAINYDFGELLPGSISGRVHADPEGDCEVGPEDIVLEGVQIDLLDESGNLLATTFTDSEGRYTFDGLAKGNYQVFEHQPDGYYDGDDHAGSAGGEVDGVDTIFNINLGAEQDAVNYDFCEHIGVNLSGHVYHDASNDGVFDPSETGIGGATVILLDSSGSTVATTTTSTDPSNLGFYEFTDLEAGDYMLVEIQPDGWIDGLDTPGNLGGSAENPPPGDKINEITLAYGTDGVDYDFGELLPGSISGRVHADPEGDCEVGPEDIVLEGVQIDLLDESGNLLATTFTDADGRYTFDGLAEGTYQVFEHQPAGYYDGDDHAGTAGGTTDGVDTIFDINLNAQENAVDYDFCEHPGVNLSGHVYHDESDDGIFDADEDGIGGVTLLLFDSSGSLVASTVTSSSAGSIGFYEFNNLEAGTYRVVEIHPSAWLDGKDTVGNRGGTVDNSGVGDQISSVTLAFGLDGINYNFGELLGDPPLFFQPPPEAPPEPTPPTIGTPPENPTIPPVVIPPEVPNILPSGASKALGYTWHLSVVDAGLPRDIATDAPGVATLTSLNPADEVDWRGLQLDLSSWTLAEGDQDGDRNIVFGSPKAIPVTGDFNGDGITDTGVYIQGQWFIDVNGNGIWDDEDLWARLGTDADLPVTGDWDGDGKDDIGIFGPAWPRDPHAIAHEPGIPDPDNPNLGKPKNMPPHPDEAALGARTMKLTSQGKIRKDLIDHVFFYGTAGDAPITGDWNGDGIETIGVYRNGKWHIDVDGDGKWTEADGVISFGQSGDLPVIGDFNGDGIDEMGVFRNGTWILDSNGNRELDALDKVFEMGEAGDLPVAGDFDNDGIDEPGLYHPHIDPAA